MAVFFIIFWQEIRFSLLKGAKILANWLFFVIFMTIFFILSQKTQENNQFYLIITIWLSLICAVIFSATEFLQQDFNDGAVEQIILGVENFENFILARMSANWVIFALPIIIFASFILQFNSEIMAKNALIILTLASLIINFICCFAGSLSSLGKSSSLISVIILPLLIPIILVANSALLYDFAAGVKILLGIFMLIIPVTIFASAKIIKIASE